MTDQEHLVAIRKAAQHLADQLNAAAGDGLNVECSAAPGNQWLILPFLKNGWTVVTNVWRTTVVEEPKSEAA